MITNGGLIFGLLRLEVSSVTVHRKGKKDMQLAVMEDAVYGCSKKYNKYCVK